MCFLITDFAPNELRLSQSLNQNLQTSREVFVRVLTLIAAINVAVRTQV
jgi:hypothetical protein